MTVVDFFFDIFSTISNFWIFPTTAAQRAPSEKRRGLFFRIFRKHILGQVLRKSLLRVTTVDDRCRFFFSDFFSTSSAFSIFPKKIIGPDVSENIVGRPEGSGRASGGVRGRSGRPRGGVWGSPGGSGGRLGRVLGALGAILERPWRQSDFGSFFYRF